MTGADLHFVDVRATPVRASRLRMTATVLRPCLWSLCALVAVLALTEAWAARRLGSDDRADRACHDARPCQRWSAYEATLAAYRRLDSARGLLALAALLATVVTLDRRYAWRLGLAAVGIVLALFVLAMARIGLDLSHTRTTDPSWTVAHVIDHQADEWGLIVPCSLALAGAATAAVVMEAVGLWRRRATPRAT